VGLILRLAVLYAVAFCCNIWSANEGKKLQKWKRKKKPVGDGRLTLESTFADSLVTNCIFTKSEVIKTFVWQCKSIWFCLVSQFGWILHHCSLLPVSSVQTRYTSKDCMIEVSLVAALTEASLLISVNRWFSTCGCQSLRQSIVPEHFYHHLAQNQHTGCADVSLNHSHKLILCITFYVHC